jgi:hypothetical protein
LDATHFRQRAARAREMAQSGDDVRLSRMLLEVAFDLDAEAEAIEAGGMAERRSFPRVRLPELGEALLHIPGPETDTRPAQVINLSIGGAKLRIDRAQLSECRVILELLGPGLRLAGTVLRARGSEAAMCFDPASSADPGLARLLRSEARTGRVDA